MGLPCPAGVTIQLGAPKAPDKRVYTFSLTDYTFDGFPVEDLLPIEGLEAVGDAKPAPTK